MSSPKRILIVDPEEETRAQLVAALNDKGYSVLTAVNLAEVDEQLRQAVIHLAVTEISIEAGQPGLVCEPFEPVKALRKYNIPFIVFSRQDDPESIRRAFTVEGAEQHFSKRDDNALSELIAKIDKVFFKMKTNLNLQINGSPDPTTIAKQLGNLSGPDIHQPTDDDVRHILQQLFHEDISIHTYPLLKDKTQTGSILLRVRHKRQEGWARQVVVKLNTRYEIERDMANYQRLKPHMGGNLWVDLEEPAYSREWGGIFYRLIGVNDLENIRTLKEVFLHGDVEQVSNLLNAFFETPKKIFLSADREAMNLLEVYSRQLKLEAIPSKGNISLAPTLSFKGLDKQFLNPVVWLPAQDREQFEVFSQKYPCCSYLRGENVLVEDGKFWSLDFAHINEGHALNDFAELEANIKFNLMPMPSWRERLDFEQRLLAPHALTQTIDGNPPFEDQNLERAYHAIMMLRCLASQLVQLDNNGKPEYYQALLFHTLDVWQTKDDSIIKEHALLAAALLCERLNKWPKWDDTTGIPLTVHGKDCRSVPPPTPPVPLPTPAPNPTVQPDRPNRTKPIVGVSVIAALSIITLLIMSYFEVPLFGYAVVLVLIVFFAIIFFVLDDLISAKEATQSLQEMVLALLKQVGFKDKNEADNNNHSKP